MSRGFVREDDQEEPVFIPPRAPLPAGMENLVTPRGLKLLQEERAGLESKRGAVHPEEGAARRRELAEINGRLALLDERIASARVVDPVGDRPEEVRFGTTVTYRIANGPQQGVERTFTLVGVDEASIAEGRIAFTAPVAEALLGKTVGEAARFRLGETEQAITVLGIE